MQTTIEPKQKTPDIANGENRKLSGRGRMTIFVRRERVYVNTRVFGFPSFVSGFGYNLSTMPKRVAVFEDVLDHKQREALEDAEALAQNLGVKLEIKDIGKFSIFRRIANYFLGIKVPSTVPTVSVSGETVFLLARSTTQNENGKIIDNENMPISSRIWGIQMANQNIEGKGTVNAEDINGDAMS